MSKKHLPYFSTQLADDLLKGRADNSQRYLSGDFEAEILAPGASMELPILVDLERLSELDADKTEFDNSLVVWRALDGLTPSLARENRIWTRLCHGEALKYSRTRWLLGKSGEELLSQIRIHMFATTQTMCRDDNAVGRLWWNAFIANKAARGDVEAGLSLMLKTADIRSNFVERTWMTTRQSVANAVFRSMKDDPWLTSAEKNFRELMKALNIEGAGNAFEVMSEPKIDAVIKRAIDRAHAAVDGV